MGKGLRKFEMNEKTNPNQLMNESMKHSASKT